MKKLSAILMALLIFFVFPVSASAKSSEIAPFRYSTFHIASGSFSIDSNWKSNISATAEADSGIDVEITAIIQKDTNGTWTDVKTFTSDLADGYASPSKEWQLLSGNTYRCKFVFKAYENGRVVETVMKYKT